MNPVSVTNKSFKPTSMPTVLAVTGIDTGSDSHRQETKYLPALSLEMVTVDGADGNSRLQRTSSGDLLFAMYNSPSRYLNALAVNSAACLCRLLLKVGYAVRPAKKLAKAACWWRNDCWRGTQETSFSHMYSGSFFERRKASVGLSITDLFLSLVVRIGTPTKDRIVDEAHTAERLR